MSLFLNCRSRFTLIALATTWLAASCGAPDKSVQAQTTPAPRATAKATAAPSTPAVSVKLAENGKALLPIVISAQASEREKAAAQTLAEYLQRITGGEFKIETASAALTPSTRGIALGTAARFSPAPGELKTGEATAREDYILRSHAAGVLFAGASELAVEHAVWDLLYRVGHRQFFPGATWEVVPSHKTLSVAVNVVEQPDYYSRRIWPGFGYLPENRAEALAWNARNRVSAGIELRTGHAYDGILHRHKAEFAAHPEYLTRPGSKKFCVSNPGLQQLVIKDALAQFEKDPTLQSVSMDPSDGGGWETEGACRDGEVYKSITDRAISLANIVAEAVTKKYPDKFVGLYAYNEHSPPPTINVHPRVVVSIATSFIRGGYTLDELFAGWSAKASLLGVREYYSVHTWDRDLPGRARGSNLDYLARTITEFHGKKARFLTTEAGDNWGPNGLGYYIAARLLWDTDKATQIEAIKSDFLEKAFGPAREPMAEYYRLIEGANKPLLSSDLVGRMYRQLDKALKSTPDAAIRTRLFDLALYTRYVELYSDYSQSTGPARQAAFEKLVRFGWQIRRTHMVHTLALWRDLANRDKQVSFPDGADWRVAEEKNPWKSSAPIAAVEIQKLVAGGIANNKILDFQLVSFSNDLIPATPLKLSSAKPGGFNMLRGSQDLYTWVEKSPATITLQGSGGHIYRDRGPAKFELYPLADAEMKMAVEVAIAPDKETHDVPLQTGYPGLHRINVSDGAAGTSISWPAGVPMTVESSLDAPTRFAGGRWTMYFYVPKGTKIVGGYRNAVLGGIRDGDGKSVFAFTREGAPGYWSIPVAPGQDGKLWQLSSVSGQVMLMTTPPYLARSAEELLLPKEVVAADAAR